MKICKADKNMNNTGSAIITALVVSTVLMVLCLSLLAVAYSLFLSQKANTSDMSQRELLYSSIEILEDQLTNASYCNSPSFNNGTIEIDPNTQEEIYIEDLKGQEFGKYVLKNIWKDFELVPGTSDQYEQNMNSQWLYYDSNAKDSEGKPTNLHGDISSCSKYFYLKSLGSMPISVQLYWVLPFDSSSKKWDGTETMKEGTILHAIYKLYNSTGETQVKTERVYKLEGTNQQIDNLGNEINSSGTYEIVFCNSTSVYPANQYFLPGPLYYDTEDSIPDNFSSFNKYPCTWYIDNECTKEYSADNKLEFNDVNGKKTVNLYTDWGGNTPVLVRFIARGNILANIATTQNSTIQKNQAPSTSNVDNSYSFMRWSEYNGSGDHFDDDFFSNGTPDSLESSSIVSDTDVIAIYEEYCHGNGNNKVPYGQVKNDNYDFSNYVDLTLPNVTSKTILKWCRVAN